MSKDDWMEWVRVAVGSLLGLAAGSAAGYWGAQQLPWWLLSLVLGLAAAASWLPAKRLIPWRNRRIDNSLIEGAMDLVVTMLENAFLALPFAAWLVCLWIASAIGAFLVTDWRAALGVAAWPLLTAVIFIAKIYLDEWLETRRLERAMRTKEDETKTD